MQVPGPQHLNDSLGYLSRPLTPTETAISLANMGWIDEEA